RKLAGALQTKASMTFDAIRKVLAFIDSQKFNFEQADHREKLKGNSTEATLRKILGKQYDGLCVAVRDEIIRDLLFVDVDAVIGRHAVERWGLNQETADKLAAAELESGYLHLSEKALKALIPHLERGKSYMDAVTAAGYERPDERTAPLRDELSLKDLPNLRNPIVMAALHQMRRVVNSIARAYGKPAKVRVEMARDLKVSLKKRSENLSKDKKNRLANEKARERLEKEFGRSNATRDDLIKYKLWEECGHGCPYTGRTIAKGALFSEDWEVDHILPRPRSGDDSFMNKTLCYAPENRTHKRNQTPWEAYGSDEQRWGEILHRIERLPWPKRRKFSMKEIPEDFISRQLNDTRYIAREARAYLETLVGKYNAQIGNGRITDDLRRRWGLNKILHDSGEKTREDHRHHAIDAVVIALTTPAVAKRMSEIAARDGHSRGDGFPPPWEGFRDEVKRRIERIIVSHRVLRKLRGALHEETNYGILKRTDEKGQPLYAVRKPLASLTAAELGRIPNDGHLREIVCEHLRKHGVDLSKPDPKSAEWKKATDPANPPHLPNRNGAPVPIRRVRLHKPLGSAIAMKNPAGEVYRAVDSGSNHHIVIFEYSDGKKKGQWDGEVVSMFEAARRAKAKEPLIRREVGEGRTFIMSLSINEMVKVVNDGRTEYWRVQKIDSAAVSATFRLHTAATLTDNAARRIKSPNGLRELKAAKIVIDPLGRVRSAND
ncbi:MAG: type II CRISPR RNA-guided endonuclease Cas9, partial [Candidatus Binataceae bacterium]